MRCVMVIIAVLIGLICILIFSDNIFHNHHKPTRGIEDGKISGRYRSKDPKEQNLQGVKVVPVRPTQKFQVHQMPSKDNPDIKSQPSPKSPELNRVGINPELQDRKKNTEDGKLNLGYRNPNLEERKPTLEGRKPNSEDRRPNPEDRNRNLEDRRRNRVERILRRQNMTENQRADIIRRVQGSGLSRRQNMTVNQRPGIIRRVQGSGFSRRQNMTVNQRPDIIRRVQGSGFSRRQDISKRPDRFNSITNSRNSGERKASTTAQRKELLRSVKKNPELKDALCNKEAWGKYFPCMTLQPQPSLSVPICTYKPTENSPTSKTMSSGTYWEWKGVSAIIEQLTQHPQADFIDIGASIGAYSLAVVHALKRHTIAVEPNNQSTRRMAVAACHAEVYKHITLLNRGILDAKSAMNVTMSDKDPESLDFKTTSASCAGCRKRAVQVITLNDLINKVKSTQAVIKVDTNGNEFRIFTDSAAGNFFTRIQVLAVLIDMEYYVNKQSLSTETRQKVDATIKFFSSRNYEPRKLDGKTALNSNWQEWPAQVLFVKTGNKVSR